MFDILKQVIRDERGLTLIEYGLGVALAITVGTLALANLGADIGGALGAAGTMMPD